jgi:hypothetical protein
MRITKRDGWHLEVTPHDDTESACQAMRTAIRRHVDGVSTVTILSSDASHCSFCGSRWTEDDTAYNGGCCDRDEAGNPEFHGTTP